MASDITIGRLVYEFVADTARFIRDVSSAEGALGEMGKYVKDNSAAFQQVGIAATAAGGAIVAGLGFATKKAVEFDQAAANAFSIINDGKTTLENVRDTAMEWGRTTVFTATEAANAYYKLASAGLNANQIQAAGNDTIRFAVATAQEFDSAAETLVGTVKGLGLQFSQTGEVANTFAAAIQGSNLNAERLTGGLKYATPVAASFGLSVDELSSYLMIMNDNMLLGEMGGRAIEQAFRALSKVAPETEEKLGNYGLKIEDIAPKSHTLAEITQTLAGAGISGAEAFEIFGSEGGRALSILLNGLQNNSTMFDDYLGKLDNASALQSAYNKQMEGAENILKLLSSAFEYLQITIGDTLLPVFKDLVIQLTDFIALLGKYLKENPNITKALVVLAASIGGILVTLGPVLVALPGLIILFESLAAVSGVLAAAISGPLIIAIGALAAIAVVVYTQWDKVVQLWNIAEEAFAGFLSALTGDGEAFKIFWLGLWSYIKDFFVEIWSYVIAYFDFIMERVSGFDQMVKDTFGSWETFWIFIGQMLQNVFSAMVNVFTAFFDSVLSGLQIFVDTVTGSFDTILNSANWLLEKVGMNTLPLIGDRFENFSTDIKAFMEGAAGAVKGAFDAIFERGEKANEENKKNLEDYKNGVKPPLEEASAAFEDHGSKVESAMDGVVRSVNSASERVIASLNYYSGETNKILDAAEVGYTGAWDKLKKNLEKNISAINRNWQGFNKDQKTELDNAIAIFDAFSGLSAEQFEKLSDEAKDAFKATISVIQEYAGTVEDAGERVSQAVNDMATDIQRARESLEATSVSIMDLHPQLKQSFEETYSGISGIIQNFYRGMLTQEMAIEKIVELMRLFALESGETMKDVAGYFSEALGEMKDDVDDAVGASWFTDGVMKFIDLFSRLKDSAKDSLGGLVEAAKDNLGELKDTLVDIKDGLSNAGLPIGDLLPGGGGGFLGAGGGGSNPIGIEQPVGDPMKNRGGTSNPIFFVSQLVVREEVDIHKVAQQLAFQMQTQGAL